jgi:hypothetical protein
VGLLVEKEPVLLPRHGREATLPADDLESQGSIELEGAIEAPDEDLDDELLGGRNVGGQRRAREGAIVSRPG